jgi:branched-chain amino acid transport system substrate-binding protein
LRRNPWALAMVALVGAVSVAGCSAIAAENKVPGAKLTIYASVPLIGPSSVSGQAVFNGAELALDAIHARIGRYRIALRELNDATLTREGWDPGQTTLNVRQATQDKTTIGYIGEFNSGASAVAIPLLNRAGIPQISSSSTAVGLTSGGPAAAPGEPEKYYPTGARTFARVVPNDSVQATVQAELMRSLGCSRTYVLSDDEVDGIDEASSFEVAAKAAGLKVVGSQTFEPRLAGYTEMAQDVDQSSADCVLISALTESGAPLVVKQVAAADPQAMLFGSAGLAETTFTDPAVGGIPTSLDPRMLITDPTLDPADYPPAGRRFFVKYARRFGPPEPAAIFGYAAMSLMLEAVDRATDHGSHPPDRTKVLAAIFSPRGHASVLGHYTIDRQGDTSLKRYGVYRVVGGQLSFLKVMTG